MSEQVTDVTVESIAVAVTRAVAAIEPRDLLELPPLYNAVDVGALKAFCAHDLPVPDESKGTVSFTYSESVVTIDRGESVTVDAVPASEETVSELFGGTFADAAPHADD